MAENKIYKYFIMAGFKKRNYRKRVPRKSTTAVGKRKSSVSASVKSYIKRAIHVQIENKSIQINPGALSFGNVLESPDFNAYPMLPCSTFWTIPQGTGQGARVGNQIKTRKCYLNYVIRPLPYDAGTNPNPNPSMVRLMLGYVKNTPSFAPISGDISQLFDAGSTSVGPVGSLKDLISVYNTDYWTIKKSWTHKLGYANNSGTGSLAASQFFANNDFNLNVMKRMDITQYVAKTCVFNDTSATTNTKNLFFMFYAVTSTGTIASNVSLLCNIDYWIDYIYEDA